MTELENNTTDTLACAGLKNRFLKAQPSGFYWVLGFYWFFWRSRKNR